MSGKKTKYIKAFWDVEGSFIVLNTKLNRFHFHGKHADAKNLIAEVHRGGGLEGIPNWLPKRKRKLTIIMG